MFKKISNHEQTQIKKIITGIIGIVLLFYVVSCDVAEDSLPLSEATPPSAVEDLNVDSFTANQVTLSWTAPSNTGTVYGSNATLSGYLVKYKETTNTNSLFIEIDENNKGVRLTEALVGTSTTATVTGLRASTSYTFLVVAINSGDVVGLDADAPTVEQTTETIVPIPPSAVEDLNVDSFTANQVTLSWTAPSNTGTVYGSNATLSGYLVKYKTVDSDFIEIDEESEGVRLTEALVGTSTTATVTGLRASTSYTFLVVAINSGDVVGLDADAPTVEQTTKSVPAPPKSLRKINTCDKTTSVELAWDASSGATSYKLYRGDDEIINSNTTSYTDTGLTAGTAYTYKVYACSTDGCSDDFTSLEITTPGDNLFKSIIDSGRIPADLTCYDQRSQEIFSRYVTNTPIVARYLRPGGTGDGSSPTNKAGNLKTVLGTITNAAADRVYAVLLTGGTYRAGSTMAMKNYVAIIGGVDEDLEFSDTVTALDGQDSYRVFHNEKLDDTALLYGVTVTKGKAKNTAESGEIQGVGGGMYNENSFPSLVKVTFSENTAEWSGGGIFNYESSPTLIGVTFSGNTAERNGGGMVNDFFSSPTLIGVTFSGNTAAQGGGMYNDNNGKGHPLIINGIFWGNTASSVGPQFYFFNDSTAQENLRIYNSIVEGGAGTLTNGTTYTNVNQGGFVSGGGMAPVVISFSNIITTDPGLLPLANNGGSVLTHAIAKGSSAVDWGLYVKKSGNTFYYSADKSTWYTEPDLSGKTITPPADAEDLTATDATGYTRTGKPDLGAYEAR